MGEIKKKKKQIKDKDWTPDPYVVFKCSRCQREFVISSTVPGGKVQSMGCALGWSVPSPLLRVTVSPSTGGRVPAAPNRSPLPYCASGVCYVCTCLHTVCAFSTFSSAVASPKPPAKPKHQHHVTILLSPPPSTNQHRQQLHCSHSNFYAMVSSTLSHKIRSN